jgi:hypothetical protein
LRHGRIRRPEFRKFLEVAIAPHLLPCNGAVHADIVPLDVLENPVVGCRLSALVVLGLQTIDRDDELKAA